MGLGTDEHSTFSLVACASCLLRSVSSGKLVLGMRTFACRHGGMVETSTPGIYIILDIAGERIFTVTLVVWWGHWDIKLVQEGTFK